MMAPVACVCCTRCTLGPAPAPCVRALLSERERGARGTCARMCLKSMCVHGACACAHRSPPCCRVPAAAARWCVCWCAGAGALALDAGPWSCRLPGGCWLLGFGGAGAAKALLAPSWRQAALGRWARWRLLRAAGLLAMLCCCVVLWSVLCICFGGWWLVVSCLARCCCWCLRACAAALVCCACSLLWLEDMQYNQHSSSTSHAKGRGWRGCAGPTRSGGARQSKMGSWTTDKHRCNDWRRLPLAGDKFALWTWPSCASSPSSTPHGVVQQRLGKQQLFG
jgi:hypothetical protein